MQNGTARKPVRAESVTYVSGIIRNPCLRYRPFINGAPERIRTSDPQIRSLVLYPAELRVQTQARQYVTLKNVVTRRGGETELRCTAFRGPQAWSGRHRRRPGESFAPFRAGR